MRSRRIRALVICAFCAVLVAVLLLFSFFGAPRKGEYESEHGTHYYLTGEELTRLDVAVTLSVGEQVKNFAVDVVYTYDVYMENFEKRISMRLARVEYTGEDKAVKNLVSALNRDIVARSEETYQFGNLSLKAATDGGYARGAGSVRINDELLRRVGK